MTRRCDDDCGMRHCIVCDRVHLADTEPQTCVHCLGRARGNLTAILDAYALLPDELVDRGGVSFQPIPRGSRETAIPGGDALVLLAAGNTSSGDPTVERSDDPQPPVAILASWEDDWRRMLALPAAGTPTMGGTTTFLASTLGWAAQHHPAFADFADDLARVRGRLETATGSAEPLDRGAVRCPECGDRLARHYRPSQACPHIPEDDRVAEPAGGWRRYGNHEPRRRVMRPDEADQLPEAWRPCGCDQGGRTDNWQCTNRACGTIITAREYNFALWAQLEGETHREPSEC